MAVPTTRILNLDGTLRLNLAPAAGYRRRQLPDRGVVNDNTVETGPYLDGEAVTHWRRAAVSRTLVIRVDGATWEQVEARTDALINAVVDSPFLYEVGVEGHARRTTWRSSGPATSVDASFTREDLALTRRLVTIDVRLQPNPVVTGV